VVPQTDILVYQAARTDHSITIQNGQLIELSYLLTVFLLIILTEWSVRAARHTKMSARGIIIHVISEIHNKINIELKKRFRIWSNS